MINPDACEEGGQTRHCCVVSAKQMRGSLQPYVCLLADPGGSFCRWDDSEDLATKAREFIGAGLYSAYRTHKF